ncbi:MAG: YiiX family permuted papain-like enzyme [bacterium]
MKKRKEFKFLILVILILLINVGCSTRTLINIQPGDIIFQTSQSSQSHAIQLATHSKYSHMGIIFFLNGQYYVYEASKVVKFTPLAEWIHRGEDGHYIIKRLKDAEKLLTPNKITTVEKVAFEYKDRPYDLYFEWSDKRIYCSELVWKIYKRSLNIEIGKLKYLKDFDLKNDIVQKKLKERFGDKIPYDEFVISPQAMFESDLLVTVEKK